MKAAPIKLFSKLINTVKKKPLLPTKLPILKNAHMADSVAKNVAEKVSPDIILAQTNKAKIAELLGGLSAIGSTTAYAKVKESSQKLGGYSSTTA